VHGIGGSADDWREQLPLLAGNYRVLAIDLPGFGQSSKGSHLYSPENYARVIHELIRSRLRTPFFLVGHSMGGALALDYAARYPQRLEGMILADVAGVLHRLAYNKFLVGNWLYERSTTPRWSSELLQSFAGKFLEGLERTPFSTDDMLEMDFDKGRERRIAAMALLEADFSELLPRIVVPVSLLWGREDGVAPLRTAEVLLRRLPQTRLEIIEDAQHSPMTEQAEAFNQLLNAALHDEFYPDKTRIRAMEISDRIGRCQGEQGAVFTGGYQRIELRNCSDVQIHDAAVESLSVFESRVAIQRSRIQGKALAIDAVGSDIKMTDVLVEAEVAIQVARSRLDLAAVDLTGSRAAIQALSNSKAVFSLCRIQSPHTQGDVHAFYRLSPRNPL
jgi:pimeloyl-ACP methyl ester carboxylesterase